MMIVYREHYQSEMPNPIPDGWIYAGTDDEFGVLDRWMVPVPPVITTVVPDNSEPVTTTVTLAEPGVYAVVKIRDGS